MQILVIACDTPSFQGQIRHELESVMEKGIIRFIDVLFVSKDKDGNTRSLEAAQLDEKEKMRFGAAVEALLGYGVGGKSGERR